MKICYIVPWFPSVNPTTPEARQGVFEYRYIKNLSDEGNQIRVLSIRWNGQAEHEKIGDNVEVSRVPCLFVFRPIRYPVPGPFRLPGLILRVCREWDPDVVVFSHMIYLTSLSALFLKNKINKPVVVTTDVFPGLNWSFGNRLVDAVGHLYTLTLAKRLLAAADGVQLLVSGLERHVAGLGVDAGKAFLVNRGVDVDVFRPGGGREAVRGTLGIGKDDILMLFVGRLDVVKGVPYLLEAAMRAMREHDNVRLLIVGEGIMGDEYRAMARGFEGRVIFAGYRSDVPELMRASDIFVSPSLSEGAANAVMEASASGLAIVATAVGEIPGIVEDGATGLLVRPKDAEGLYRALTQLIGDGNRCKAMGAAGRKRMEERYCWDVVRRQVDVNYRRVMDKFAGRAGTGPVVARRAAVESERADAR